MSSRADFIFDTEPPQHYGLEASLTYIWDVPTLAWVKSTGGGGGGGAVTIADGADVAEGSTGDAAWVAGSGTVISLLKTIASSGAAAGLTDAQLRATPVPVSGTFFQATQPVSAAALPLPAGAATSALQTQPGVDIGDVTVNNGAAGAAVNIQDGGNSITVYGTFFQGTQPVSGPLTDAQLRATPVPVSGTIGAVTSITNPVSTKTDLAPAAPTAASVGVASAQAVAANASRKGLILTNVSNARISFGLGSTAVLDSGITLYPGGVAEMDEFWFDTGAVNAIASAAASPLAIQELS